MADTNLTYLHPSIVSGIDSEESTYQVSDGVTTLFVADTFEKGEDNKVKLVTSVDEFLFKYGEPNYAKYGQAAYNVIRWLENSGQAYVLRVLPADAQYSHAILNIQTKTESSGKSIKDNKGEIVKIDDVTIRPIISYLKANNTNLEGLKNAITLDRDNEMTIDGYSNNFIMAVYPTGRGSAYNDLGFRISLNTTYDSLQDARVYNFEVIRFDEYMNTSVIEGPFYVTFDPDALTSSNESMFIENVVNRYSENLRVVFNVDAYLKVAEIINPKVDPNSIDILTGKTRKNIDGTSETFFHEKTNSNLDVHVSLHKYGSDGEIVTSNGNIVLNIASYDDIIEESIISLDNSIRDEEAQRSIDKVTYMKMQFPKVGSKIAFETDLDILYKYDIENNTRTGSIADILNKLKDDSAGAGISLYTKFLNSVVLYNEENKNTEENYAETYLQYSYLENAYDDLLDDCNQINASYSLTVDRFDLNFMNIQNGIMNSINNCTLINTSGFTHKNNILDISDKILHLYSGNFEGEVLEELSYILSLINDEIYYVYYNLLSSCYDSTYAIDKDTETGMGFKSKETIEEGFENIISIYNSTIKTISDIKMGYINVDKNKLNELYGNINTIIDFLDSTIRDLMVKNLVNFVEYITSSFINGAIDSELERITNEIKEKIEPTDTNTVEEIIEFARSAISNEESAIIDSNIKLYNNHLQNFKVPIKLAMGSDGSFEYSTSSDKAKERNTAIKNELIKAYRGQIDADVANKRLIEFDHILDCNYDVDIKNAIVTLARDIRGDFFYWADTNIQPSPSDVLDWRQRTFNVSSRHVGIFSQDLTFYDAYTGKDIKFTTPYVLAQKVPYNAINYGLHYPIAGPRRGLVDGFKALCWSPNEAYKEQLYTAKVNYIEQDSRRTKIGCQLTTDSKNGPLSNINNVLTILKMQRNVEKIVEDYQFEFNDDETRNALYYELNDYLSTYITNRSCETVSVEVIASDYDKQQKILRVNVTVKFHDVIERIVISFNVQK